MKLTISKSKNAESLYISQSYINDSGKSTTKTIKKLGNVAKLMAEKNMTRDEVIAWARQEVKAATAAYKSEQELQTVLIPLHANKLISMNHKSAYSGGYLFLQYIYYSLHLDQVCKKIKSKHKFRYDLNAILSDLIYTRILFPASKYSSYKAASSFLESPTYSIQDMYRSLSILASECDFIQSEAYKNCNFVTSRNDKILYYDCTNYYFEIEEAEGIRQYGKSKEHRPNPIVQMGLFTDADGIPLAFSLFPGNQNEQTSLSPLEQNVIRDFGCNEFIYCSDAGLASQKNRRINHTATRAFIVTQSIKKLRNEYKEAALNKQGFRNLKSNKLCDLSNLPQGCENELYYKELPYDSPNMEQRLIITYSPKYAAYQKAIREKQLNRAGEMLDKCSVKKERRNPNDPARFIKQQNITADGEIANKKKYSIDWEKVAQEAAYDGLYAVCTDLLDDPAESILKVSEGRWQIEANFRIMKTEFSARPVYVRREDRIKAHFLVCFLSLLVYKLWDTVLDHKYTADALIGTLRKFNFASIGEQGYIPTYERTEITDALHKYCEFRTDYEFISRSKMKSIEKASKAR